eukprot:765465-Pelagomonas_calceolata.AAC.2
MQCIFHEARPPAHLLNEVLQVPSRAQLSHDLHAAAILKAVNELDDAWVPLKLGCEQDKVSCCPRKAIRQNTAGPEVTAAPTCKLSRMSTSRANFSRVFSMVSLPRTLGRLLMATSLP